MKTKRTFTLRVEETALDKMHYIANQNKRSVNNQLEILIDQFIADFEKSNGSIQLSDNQD